MDCSPPGSFVHGILQARVLEEIAMLSSRESSLLRDQNCVTYISWAGGQVWDPVIYITCEHSFSEKLQVLPVILFLFPLSDKKKMFSRGVLASA